MTAPVDAQRYRETIGHFATGVAVVTAHGAQGPAGMTANALCSLSLDPLLLLVCFDREARTLPLVHESGRFAVNVLSQQQHAIRAYSPPSGRRRRSSTACPGACTKGRRC